MTQKFDPSLLNTLLSFTESLDSVVCWASTADYKQQLFLNPAFENVWSMPKEQLQQHPEIWANYLVEEDGRSALPKIYSRPYSDEGSLLAFRVQRPDGQVRWMKSISTTLYDNHGQPALVIGYDEMLAPELWLALRDKEIITNTKSSFLDHLTHGLKNEFQLITKEQLTQATKSEPVQPSIQINGQTFYLSHQQQQCLNYLLQGMSAKQTAWHMNLSTRTVENYLTILRQKLGVRSKIALISALQAQR